MNMLGVPGAVAPDPGSDPTTPPPAPTPYADKLQPQNTTPDLLPESASLGSAVSRMFWRGNLERTCRTSTANGSQELLALQSQCVASAATGGNPNACTACVELAEPHIPRCFELGVPWAETSKCSVIGAEPITDNKAPRGLPTWWFDYAYRHIPPPNEDNLRLSPGDDLCSDSIAVAMDWCTGTNLIDVDADSAEYSNDGYAAERDTLINFVQFGDTINCPDGIGINSTPGQLRFGTDHRRRAQALTEDLSTNPTEWICGVPRNFRTDC
jgi:hypothetical protein